MAFAGADTSLTISLFGPGEIQVAGPPPPPLPSPKGVGLLALLVLRHDREVTRDWLAATLWPDSSDDLNRGNLRRTLTDLRKALGAASARLVSPTPQTLALHLADGEADVLTFDAALRQGE